MNHDEIEKRIAEAPEPLRSELQRLYENGTLTNPRVRQAVLKAAHRVANEQATQLPSRNNDSIHDCSKSDRSELPPENEG